MKIKSLLILKLIATSALATESEIVGTCEYEIPQGNSLWSVPFVGETSFSGRVIDLTWDASTGETLITVNTDGMSPGAFSNHYLEFGDGSQAGFNLDISSNSNGEIWVTGDATAEGLSVGDRVIVRSHVTMSTAFPDGSGLVPFVDTISLFNSGGNRLDLFWNSIGGFWMDVFGTPHDDEVIRPGQGFLIFSSQSINIKFGGQGDLSHVKTSPTLSLAEANSINLIGASNPFFGESTAFIDLGLEESLAPFLDSVSLFSTDGSLSLIGTYLSDGGFMSGPVAPNSLPPITLIDGNGEDASSIPVENGASLSVSVLADTLILVPPVITIQ